MNFGGKGKMGRFFRRRGLLSLVAALIVAAFASTSLATQSPSVTIEGCGRSGPRIDQGQTGIHLGDTALTVPVPDSGTFFSLPGVPDVPGPALFICHVESESSIVIDVWTAKEISRAVGDASGAAVLDELAANARIEPVAPPSMTPPRTGYGGLKAR
jgi:hypothetical protein